MFSSSEANIQLLPSYEVNIIPLLHSYVVNIIQLLHSFEVNIESCQHEGGCYSPREKYLSRVDIHLKWMQ